MNAIRKQLKFEMLRDFPWQDLWDKKIKAPFIPPKEDNFDQKNINEDWKDQDDE